AMLATATLRDYLKLLKPGVMALVVFTGAAGMWMAPVHLHPFYQLITILCIALCSGAGAAFNMWYDRDIDAIMTRTRNRPIPGGRIAAD
ncbi:UbiA family prenyltransferase, partial [Enterococcus faecium]